MKLHADANPSLNTVTAYGPGFIEINRVRYESAVAFGPEGDIRYWPAISPQDISTSLLRQACGLSQTKADPLAFLDADDSAALARDPDQPEVLLVGTGSHQHLLPMEILAPLMRQGIGVECMTTHAAARTYNVLMAEGRRVIAALLTESA